LALANALAITSNREAHRRWFSERRRRFPSTPSPEHNSATLARLGIANGGRPKIH
jgi:hypothetical protein